MLNPRFESFGLVGGLFAATALGFCGLGFCGSALATAFTLELVDAGGPNDVGLNSSIAVNAQGLPRISYFDSSAQDLEYAEKNGGVWTTETVDFDASVGGFSSLALDAQGNPHISYYDAGKGDLKYATRSGGIWTIAVVDSAGDVGLDTSIALDAQGNPRIGYSAVDASGFYLDLRYAAKNGGLWSIDVVDTTGDVGFYTSLKLDAAGNPRISYYKFNFPGGLKYAAKNGGVWNVEVVDSQGGVWTTSLALDAAGRPHISYYGGDQDLRYAFNSGGIWTYTTVDSAGNVGTYTSIALDSLGNPRIAYFNDFPANDLKYAAKNGGVWELEVVDDQRGWDPALALDAQGNPHISYYSYSNGNLRYATGAQVGTSVSEVLPASSFHVGVPWPNPAPTNGALSMQIDLPRSDELTVELFDVAGRRVAAMPAVEGKAGPQIITWTPPQTAPGVYLVRLQTSSGQSVERRWVRMR
jgi:hypothetical protein